MLISSVASYGIRIGYRWSTKPQFTERLTRRRSNKCINCRAVDTTGMQTMKQYKFRDLTLEQMTRITTRPRQDFPAIMRTVGPILEDVRRNGDQAVKTYTKKFDSVLLDNTCTPIEDMEIPELENDVKESFDVAYSNISKFHEAQICEKLEVEPMPGVVCQRISRPIESVGLYVPGGTAVLPSSALMLTVPAKIAGCQTIVLATPPTKNGKIAPEVLHCARLAGATHVLKAGGAQAIGAMAWGTESCPRVDKLFGPGNQFVTAAKMYLQNSEAMVSIDMPAGPSEVLVIADGGAQADHVACDLLSQAEHGPDSQAVLVALPSFDVTSLELALDHQLSTLPRAEVTKKSLLNSKIVLVDNKDQALEFSNCYAPEHLIINTEDADNYVDGISNAGSVFLGRYTPESVGDYASGTNHVLPTYGYARMYSGVSLDSFLKKITVQKLSQSGLELLGPHVAKMAEVETLEAHRRAVTVRLNKQN